MDSAMLRVVGSERGSSARNNARHLNPASLVPRGPGPAGTRTHTRQDPAVWKPPAPAVTTARAEIAPE
jgi:hypothetical protein